MVIQKSFTETIIKRFKMSVATVLALVHYHCHGMVHMSKKTLMYVVLRVCINTF